MSADDTQELLWSQVSAQVSQFIAAKIGLHFPPERYADLQRGLNYAAGELGLRDATACANWLLSGHLTRRQLQVLVSHLTIGETYFFRERPTFDALATHVLPELMQRRRRERHLRLWSAACCTGEEAYSLAILLDQCIPDLQDWRISILATDINEKFLQKAVAGIYGEWSFRDPPAGLKERYFTRTKDGRYALLPEIKQRVKFAPLNLAQDLFPSLATDTQAMDLILCRNALMYFTTTQVRKVIEQFRHALLDDAWLIVSPSESSHTLFPGFTPVNFPSAILYKRNDRDATARPEPAFHTTAAPPPNLFEPPHAPAQTIQNVPSTLASVPAADANADVQATAYAAANVLYSEGHYARAADTLLAAVSGGTAPAPTTAALLTRAFANQGKLSEALQWCDRWIALDPLDSAGRYLRAVILQELGDPDTARRSLQQALYLHPDFVLAHFALGNLARTIGNHAEANKHFSNALALLRDHRPDDLLPESDGLTAGRLGEIVSSLIAVEAAA